MANLTESDFLAGKVFLRKGYPNEFRFERDSNGFHYGFLQMLIDNEWENQFVVNYTDSDFAFCVDGFSNVTGVGYKLEFERCFLKKIKK